MENEEISAFFVYGTLKQSQLRGSLWPRKPLQIFSAVIQADLFDLGPYPAIAHGDGMVLGELWLFQPTDMPVTIQVLDRIEGYESLGKSNEYVREAVFARYRNAETIEQTLAYAYFIGNPKRLELARLIRADQKFLEHGVASWPDSLARVPKSFSEE